MGSWVKLIISVGLPAFVLGVCEGAVWEWEFLEWDVDLEVVSYDACICCVPINLFSCFPNNLMPLIPQICCIGGEVGGVDPDRLLKLPLLIIWI